MQDSQHRDLEGGPCLPTKINSLAQVIFSISQQKSPFEAVNLSIQIQGATRLSSITSFCLFSLRKRDLGLQGEFLSPVLSWPGADPALLWGKVSGKGTQGLCSPRWVLSLPMGHGRTQGALGKSGNAEGSSQLLLSSITHHRAHSSASGSEGLAQSRAVSLPSGTRQTLLLPSKLARLLITTDFTNVLEF